MSNRRFERLSGLDRHTIRRTVKRLVYRYGLLSVYKRPWRRNGCRTWINAYAFTPSHRWRLPPDKRSWCETYKEVPERKKLTSRLLVTCRDILDHQYEEYLGGYGETQHITVGKLCELFRHVSGSIVTPQKMGRLLRYLGVDTYRIASGPDKNHKAVSLENINSFAFRYPVRLSKVESCPKSAPINSTYKRNKEIKEVINRQEELLGLEGYPPSTFRLLLGGKKEPVNQTPEEKIDTQRGNSMPRWKMNAQERHLHDLKKGLQLLGENSLAFKVVSARFLPVCKAEKGKGKKQNGPKTPKPAAPNKPTPEV